MNSLLLPIIIFIACLCTLTAEINQLNGVEFESEDNNNTVTKTTHLQACHRYQINKKNVVPRGLPGHTEELAS